MNSHAPMTTAKIVKDYYFVTNAHGIFELHLPLQIPFCYFEKIYFPKSKLTPQVEAKCKEVGLWDKVCSPSSISASPF